jgi:hypothetical protein
MSERRGPGNRGSLMDLAKPRLAQSPLSAPIDEAERLILATDPTPAGSVSDRQEDAPAPATLERAPEPPSIRNEPVSEPVRRAPITAPELHPRQSRRPERASEEDLVSRLRKTREPIAVVGFKLPASLKEELSAVAQHNGTDMTRIVVEALHRLLPELPHPPSWKSRG